jgi:hypothetical protein
MVGHGMGGSGIGLQGPAGWPTAPPAPAPAPQVLQLYAARQLRSGESSGTEGALNEVVFAEEEQWAALIRKFVAEQVGAPAWPGALWAAGSELPSGVAWPAWWRH